jgi:hypothetical protein
MMGRGHRKACGLSRCFVHRSVTREHASVGRCTVAALLTWMKIEGRGAAPEATPQWTTHMAGQLRKQCRTLIQTQVIFSKTIDVIFVTMWLRVMSSCTPQIAAGSLEVATWRWLPNPTKGGYNW